MIINNSKIWQEGRYIDVWTIPHLLAGGILFYIFSYIKISFSFKVILSFLLMIGWEFFELYVLGVKEQTPNKILDIAIGMLGFFIMYFLVEKYGIHKLSIPFWTVVLLYIILTAWGLYSFYAQKK